MLIECLRNFEALQTLSKEWNNLLNKSSSNNIFLTWEWISLWWEIFKEDAELYVITVKDKESQIIGIAPLKIVNLTYNGFPFRQLEFIGSGKGISADYLNIIIECGREEEVINEMFITCIYPVGDGEGGL